MEHTELCSIIESLIFSADKPIPLSQLVQWVGEKKSSIEKALQSIQEFYETQSRGIRLVEVNEGFQFRTPKQNAPWVQKSIDFKPVRLSPASMEVLSIVAYKQPVTRSEVDSIRGVDSSHILKSLMDKRLVQMDGKTDDPGRPILYSTTEDFLEFFSLKSIRELPTLRDLEELSAFGDDQSVTNLPEGVKELLHEKGYSTDAPPADSAADSTEAASEAETEAEPSDEERPPAPPEAHQ